MAQVYEITRTAFNELLVGGRLNTNYPEQMDVAVWVVVKGYAHFSGSTLVTVYGVRENMGDALWSVDFNNGNQTRLQLENDLHCAAEWEAWHIVDDEPEPEFEPEPEPEFEPEPEPEAARYELRLYDTAGEPVRCATSPTFETLADAIGAADLLAEFGQGLRRAEVWDLRETDSTRAWRYGVSCL